MLLSTNKMSNNIITLLTVPGTIMRERGETGRETARKSIAIHSDTIIAYTYIQSWVPEVGLCFDSNN